MGTGDEDVDDGAFGDVVVERRRRFGELDIVADEREKSAAPSHAVTSNNCIAWERGKTRGRPQLGFLETSDLNIVPRQEVV